jgi:hypothetical protein
LYNGVHLAINHYLTPDEEEENEIKKTNPYFVHENNPFNSLVAGSVAGFLYRLKLSKSFLPKSLIGASIGLISGPIYESFINDGFSSRLLKKSNMKPFFDKMSLSNVFKKN